MNVFWGKGQKQLGLTVHDGMIVVRPGWVAFLPTKPPVNVAGAIALAVAGGVKFGHHEATFPVEQWWQDGADTFDRLVTENALAQGGFILTSSDAEVVVSGKSALLRFRPTPGSGDPAMLVFLGKRPPLEMFHGWKRGAATFDAKGFAKLCGVLSAFPFAFGCFGLYVGLTSDDYSAIETVLGVAFWWVLVVIVWGAYVWLWLRARKEKIKTQAETPYR